LKTLQIYKFSSVAQIATEQLLARIIHKTLSYFRSIGRWASGVKPWPFEHTFGFLAVFLGVVWCAGLILVVFCWLGIGWSFIIRAV
jgi:hypothetical protein